MLQSKKSQFWKLRREPGTELGLVNIMVTVFVDPCSLAVGALTVSHGRAHVTDVAQRCLILRLGLPDCWGDQGSCELVLRRTSCS